MKKRIFTIILTLCMGLPFVPTRVFAETIGTTKDGLRYTISDAGQVTITRYTGSSGAVEIPSTIEGKTVKYIDQNAFSGCTKLTSVTIPSSVTNILAHAFSGCENLTSINIPNGVKYITDETFKDCKSLTSITSKNLSECI